MSGYELYIFFLCLIVFVSLTALFGVMFYVLLKQGMKAIYHGLEDERIKTEYTKETQRKRWVNILCNVITAILLGVVAVAFVSSVCIKLSDDKVTGNTPVAKIVMSESMSAKRDTNAYLAENNLNDQFGMFDIVFTHQLPDEFDLKLYDIVVYEYEDKMVIHRIIGIEEPNEKHPDCRHFLLRGDASKFSDEFPVLYSQMKAIYRGKRIPHVGSFFAFLQSPAGYLCILLIIFAVFATPIAEKKLWQAKLARLREIGFVEEEETPDVCEEQVKL